MNGPRPSMEADLSPLRGTRARATSDFKETEEPANLHHGLAGLRDSFATLSEVRKNPGPKLSEFEESRRHAGRLVATAVVVTLKFSCTTAGRQQALGHRWHGNVASSPRGQRHRRGGASRYSASGTLAQISQTGCRALETIAIYRRDELAHSRPVRVVLVPIVGREWGFYGSCRCGDPATGRERSKRQTVAPDGATALFLAGGRRPPVRAQACGVMGRSRQEPSPFPQRGSARTAQRKSARRRQGGGPMKQPGSTLRSKPCDGRPRARRRN